MATDKETVCWKCHRALMLYVEGWRKSTWAEYSDTARIRRSMAEAYMLENTRPVIIPGELIVGQPCFDDFTEEETIKYKECLRIEAMMPTKRGRADHLALDYKLLLDEGIGGILKILDKEIEKIDFCDGSQAERYEFEFLYCCKIELEGLLKLSSAYAEQAKVLADNASGNEKKRI